MENKDYTYDDYKEACKHFAKRYGEEITDHILHIMTSICMTRDKLMVGGSFVQAIVDNNLYYAISRADEECIKKLMLLSLARFNCYVQEEQFFKSN